jgi:hypothetical protein
VKIKLSMVPIEDPFTGPHNDSHKALSYPEPWRTMSNVHHNLKYHREQKPAPHPIADLELWVGTDLTVINDGEIL